MSEEQLDDLISAAKSASEDFNLGRLVNGRLVQARFNDLATALEQMKAELGARRAGIAHMAARIAELESNLASAVAAERRAFNALTYPVSTEIDPRGYSLRVDRDEVEFAAETLAAAIRARSEGGK